MHKIWLLHAVSEKEFVKIFAPVLKLLPLQQTLNCLKWIRNEIFFLYESTGETGKKTVDLFLISFSVPEISAFKEV